MMGGATRNLAWLIGILLDGKGESLEFFCPEPLPRAGKFPAWWIPAMPSLVPPQRSGGKFRPQNFQRAPLNIEPRYSGSILTFAPAAESLRSNF